MGFLVMMGFFSFVWGFSVFYQEVEVTEGLYPEHFRDQFQLKINEKKVMKKKKKKAVSV